MEPLGKAQFKPAAQEKPVDFGTARSKRLAGRTVLVGRTPFKFDANGLCKAQQTPGRTTFLDDWKVLLAMNGVEEVKAAPASEDPVPLPEAAPVSTKDADTGPIRRRPPIAPARTAAVDPATGVTDKAAAAVLVPPPAPEPEPVDTKWASSLADMMPSPPGDLVAASEADAVDFVGFNQPAEEGTDEPTQSGSETDETTPRRRRRGKK